ncbi:MAG: formate--tetrahydrofolate ligase, partial [Candidatus Aminicenantes bacterium]|nr:formate--tetrahydrofolate ligase [Candidatus Aminicenantes bacterium]
VRALKHQGGGNDMSALKEGLANLGKHIENVKFFGFSPVVAVNVFPEDDEGDLKIIHEFCRHRGVMVELSEAFTKGGKGARPLAETVVKVADKSDGKYNWVYPLDDPIQEKIEKVATVVYGADGVIYSWDAKKKLKLIDKLGLNEFPICIAKTPLSLSDNQKKLNVPTGWRLNINEINIATGAGYVIPISGDIMLMPGLPRVPSAEKIDIDATGHHISGLF